MPRSTRQPGAAKADDRQVYGAHAHQHWFTEVFGFKMENVVGLQVRYDDIDSVGLFKTVKRRRLSTTRRDKVRRVSVSPYLDNRTKWLPKFRTVAGLRGDFYHFEVESDNPLNSGTASDGLASPKFSLFGRRWRLALQGFNLLDSEDHDIDYFYPSPLPGEPVAGVNDLHFHPIEPLPVRLTL